MSVLGWFHHLRVRDFAMREAMLVAVHRQGVKLEADESGEMEGPGLVLFDRVDAELCEALHRDSRGGFHRIVAVATTQAALGEGGAWRLLEAGAADVFAWDGMADPGAAIAARFRRFAEVDSLLDSPVVRKDLTGESPVWISALRQIVEVAAFSDASVLITGESGTGKELVARLIHELDARPNKGPFVILDCTTISPELSGSEFFGHERGAFTSAVAAREGAFAAADRGTLFLDEVGELPLSMQAGLLRVVQERAYKRLGSNVWKQLNFRLVCATNRNLLQEEARGAFRRDLYYRLASWTCSLPRLDERREDILPLVRHFLRQIRGESRPPEPDAVVRDYLLTRDYPGNVRELRQLTVRLASRHVGDAPITVGDLPPEERLAAYESMRRVWYDEGFQLSIRRALSMGLGLKEINSQTTELAIQTALADEEGNLKRAAHRLGVTDRALQMRRAQQRQNGERLRAESETELGSQLKDRRIGKTPIIRKSRL